MKIAITADLHLTPQQVDPERYRALEDIFEQIETESSSILPSPGTCFTPTCRIPASLRRYEGSTRRLRSMSFLETTTAACERPLSCPRT